MKKKIAVLISGGVDSSVALSLLKDSGADLTAFYLKIWLEDELSYLGNCPWGEDLKFVEETCEKLKVNLEIISLQREYKETVIKYVLEEIKIGNTPNPDIFCNKNIKLGVFFDKHEKDYDFFATGHYAKNLLINNEIYLAITSDEIKDQTYFLSYTPIERLNKIIFPIGTFNKNDVRKYAIEKKLPSATRKDSQGICFLGSLKFKEFVKFYCGIKIGKLIEFETNKILGIHEGFWFFTIGQRQGIGLSGGPWYVVEKNINENIIYVSKSYFDTSKNRNRICATNFNWLICEEKIPKINEKLKIKIRHGQKFYDSFLEKVDLENKKFTFRIFENDQGIAEGQFLVIYSENIIKNETICLGAGKIIK